MKPQFIFIQNEYLDLGVVKSIIDEDDYDLFFVDKLSYSYLIAKYKKISNTFCVDFVRNLGGDNQQLFHIVSVPPIPIQFVKCGATFRICFINAAPTMCLYNHFDDNNIRYDIRSFSTLFAERELLMLTPTKREIKKITDDGSKTVLTYGRKTAGTLEPSLKVLDVVSICGPRFSNITTHTKFQLNVEGVLVNEEQTPESNKKVAQYFNAVNLLRFVFLFVFRVTQHESNDNLQVDTNKIEWWIQPIDETCYGTTLAQLWSSVVRLAFRENTLNIRYTVNIDNPQIKHLFPSITTNTLKNLLVYEPKIFFNDAKCKNSFVVKLDLLYEYCQNEINAALELQNDFGGAAVDTFPRKKLWENIYDILEWKYNSVFSAGGSCMAKYHPYTETYQHLGVSEFYFNVLYFQNNVIKKI